MTQRCTRLTIRTASVLSVCALTLAACGDSSGDEGANTSSDGTESSTSSTSSTSTSSGTSSSASSTDTDTTADTTAATNVDTSTGDTSTSSGTDGTETTGGSTGGVLPFPCDDPNLPVTIVGAGSYSTIQGAADASPADATIQVCPGTYEENVVIERNLTVWGAGQDLVIVDGGGNGPVFSSLNVDVEYEGLTIQSGTYGIDARWNFAVGVSEGNLTIRDSTLTNNGGPAVRGNARPPVANFTLTLENTILTDNASGSGAAVSLTEMTATVTDCTIEDNTASINGGAFFVSGGDLTVAGGSVRRNTAANGGGAFLMNSTTEAATLTVIDSDWGTGQQLENVPNDVYCGIGNDGAGFLGANANATCSATQNPCCE